MGLLSIFAPLSDRQCRLLWLAHTTSAAGDSLMPLALPFAVLSVDASASALGAVLAVFWVTRLACTLLGGVVADRLPRRRVMLVCDVIRAAVETFAATMLLTHQITFWILLATAGTFGAASAFFGPAADGLVPQIVPGAKLQETNALLGVSRNTMNILGPALSGALIALTTPGVVFMIDAVTFIFSACFLLQVRAPADARVKKIFFAVDMRAGLREVMSRAWVRAPLMGCAILNLCLAAFMVLGPVIARKHLGGARDWGIILSCGAIGGIGGGLLAGHWCPRRPLTSAFMASMLAGVPLLMLAPPLSTAAIAAAWGVAMASLALSNTYWETSLQRGIPDSVYARVRSYDNLASYAFMPIGLIAFPWIAIQVGTRMTLSVAGAVMVVTSLIVAVVPGVRAVTQEPPWRRAGNRAA